MERIQKIEEGLSVVWEEREKGSSDEAGLRKKISEKVNEDILGDIIKEGYAAGEKNSVKLTAKGEAAAKDIIRRQRLAERLLVDVLEVGRREMDSAACEFEHILSKEVEESICTLLGHPKECPHGLPIPPGDCCSKTETSVDSIVRPLSRFKAGEAGRVVYVSVREHPHLHKLMSLGVVPGTRVFVHETYPAFVIQVEETHLALEEDVAAGIYVRRLKAE